MDDILLSSAVEAPSRASGFDAQILIILVVGIFVVAFLFFLVFAFRRMFRRPETVGLTREEVNRRWVEIEHLSEQGGIGAKMAVVEADKLLDGALRSIMMPGSTMGERLKAAGYKYPHIKDVWFAHKLRNQIAHETTFEPSRRELQQAIVEFKKALKVIGMM